MQLVLCELTSVKKSVFAELILVLSPLSFQ